MKANTMLILGLAALIGSATVAQAQELNRRPFLDPKTLSKVNNVRAQALTLGQQNRSIVQNGSGESCGDLIVNQVEDSRRPPQELIIVADDIININTNCKR